VTGRSHAKSVLAHRQTIKTTPSYTLCANYKQNPA